VRDIPELEAADLLEALDEAETRLQSSPPSAPDPDTGEVQLPEERFQAASRAIPAPGDVWQFDPSARALEDAELANMLRAKTPFQGAVRWAEGHVERTAVRFEPYVRSLVAEIARQIRAFAEGIDGTTFVLDPHVERLADRLATTRVAQRFARS